MEFNTMKITDELRQKMTTIHAEMRAILDKPAGEGGAPSGEQQERFIKLKTELVAIEKRIVDAAFLEESESRAAGQAVGSGDPRWDEMVAGLSVSRAIMSFDPGVDAGREREASAEVERRTGRKARGIMLPSEIFIERRTGQATAPGTAGGYLVNETVRPDQLVDRLRAASVLSHLGVTVLDGLTGDALIPKINGSGTVEWIAENGEPTESDLDFGQIALRPHTAAAQISMSRRILLQASTSIEALVRADLARGIGEAIDVAAINGSGGAQPTGLLITGGLPTVSLGADGGAPTVDSIIDLTGTVDVANGLSGNLKFLTNPSYVKTISKLKDGQGRYLLLDRLPGSLLGYPLARSSSVPKTLTKGSGTNLSANIFGDWSSLVVGLWSGVDILSNPYSRAGSGQVLVHAFQDVDTNVRHIESFAAHVDAMTS